jgi:diguanylate cyclase (GGDEF)-like protein/putative nucleotidyltransferase with HDIG domain
MTSRSRTAQLPFVIAPVCVAGAAAFLAAAFRFATTPHSAATLAGLGALLAGMMLADRFPVPLDGLDVTGVSLAFVFGVSSVVLFGWAAGVVVVVAAPAIGQLLEHRPGVRVAYNASVHGLAAAGGGLLIAPIGGRGVGAVVVKVALCAVAQHVANATLITAVVSGSTGKPFRPLLRANVNATILPFSLMGSASLMLVVLWQRSPVLSFALAGPLLAIALYQRSTHRALRAMRLALTDPLTGLGNHRHFHDRLRQELADAAERSRELTLCLVDIDDFKHVNDRFGHPTGDKVLAQVATRLRQDGEAFRLGGDEFAVVLPGLGESSALATATAIVERLGVLGLEQVGELTVSAGVASFPAHAQTHEELIRLADASLYCAKENGKNRVHVCRPDVLDLPLLKRLGASRDRAARYRAAAGLAQAVDARDTYTGSHSKRVGNLAARIAGRMGVEEAQVELLRLAGSLHDLGKLAIPEDILRKPGPLTEDERVVLERHPQIGFRMLEGLGVTPIAEWVLHHHERWDGSGYPDRLPGEEIPLGARILFVADAFDAMTSERVYRRRLECDEALAELERCAGSQFDPEIVSALAEEVGLVPDTPGVLAV